MDPLTLLAFVTIVPCVVLIWAIYPVWNRIRDMRKVAKTLEDIPCPVEKRHWFLGHLPYIPGPTEEGLMLGVKWLQEKQYSRYYIIYYGRYGPSINISHPDVAKQLLKTTEPKTVAVMSAYYFIKQWIGDGLLVSSGDKWFRNRRLLTPAFHFDILKPYVKIYNECVETLMDRLDKRTSLDGSVDIFDESSLCTLDIILRCAFSYEGNIQKSSSSPYVRAVTSAASLILQRIFNPFSYPDWIYYYTSKGKEFKKATEFTQNIAREVVQSRKKILNELGEKEMLKSRRYVDFLDILLLAKDENNVGLTDQEIQDEVVTFMFEGHDTTKSGISFILYNIARHPDIQALAQAEIDGLLDIRESDEITWDDLNQMPYLTKCVKESLRLHPPVPGISREITKNITIDGRVFEKNTIFDIIIWNIHHNPWVWGEDHMSYDPERFTEENMAKMDSYAFVPFSAGPRNCIGQHFAMNELKVTVARILRRFNIEWDDSVKVELLPEMILKTKNGIKLRFKERAIKTH